MADESDMLSTKLRKEGYQNATVDGLSAGGKAPERGAPTSLARGEAIWSLTRRKSLFTMSPLVGVAYHGPLDPLAARSV